MKKLQNLNFPILTNDMYIAMVTAFSAVMYSLGFTSLIFSGPLDSYFSYGFTMLVLANALSVVLIAFLSSYAVACSTLALPVMVVIANIVEVVIKHLHQGSVNEIFSTAYVTLIGSTFLVGIFLFLIGKFRLGNLVRYIPYPVIAAFMAGTGLLAFKSILSYLSGSALDFSLTLSSSMGIQLFFSLVFGFLLVYVQAQWKNPMLMPIVLLMATLVFFLMLFLLNIPMAELQPNQWFVNAEFIKVAHPSEVFDFAHIQWKVFLDLEVLASLVTLFLISSMGLLLNAGGIEKETGHEFNYNNELKYAGIANMINATLGLGVVNYFGLSQTLYQYRMGGQTRWLGAFAALFCVLILMFGIYLLAYVPKFIVAGLILSSGIFLLKRWLFQSFNKIPHSDYLVLIFICVTLVLKGFLYGIAMGVLAYLILFDFQYGRLRMVRKILLGSQIQSNIERGPASEALLRGKANQIEIFILQGYLFFGNTTNLIEKLLQRMENKNLKPLRFIIIDFKNVQGMDFSATQTFVRLKTHAAKSNVQIVFTQLEEYLFDEIVKADQVTSGQSVFIHFATLDRGLEWCEDRLLESSTALWNVSLPGQLHVIFPDEKQRELLLAYFEVVNKEEGEKIFKQNENVSEMFFLESGTVELIYEDEAGKKSASKP